MKKKFLKIRIFAEYILNLKYITNLYLHFNNIANSTFWLLLLINKNINIFIFVNNFQLIFDIYLKNKITIFTIINKREVLNW